MSDLTLRGPHDITPFDPAKTRERGSIGTLPRLFTPQRDFRIGRLTIRRHRCRSTF
jgi:hypothetical protein